MKKHLILGCSLVFLFGCNNQESQPPQSNPEDRQETRARHEKVLTKIPFAVSAYDDPREDSVDSKIAKENIRRYRDKPLLVGPHDNSIIGVEIQVKDIYDMLGINENNRDYNKVIYLMPATIQKDKKEYFTFKLAGGVIKGSDTFVDINQFYNLYEPCPNQCPKINWDDPAAVNAGAEDSIDKPQID